MHTKKSPARGIIWFVIHCFLFALISIVTKILMKNGMHIFEIVFFQTLIGAVILLPWIILRHLEGVKALSYKYHLLRAFAWALATILFFHATTVIPMARAVAISFAVPLFTTILAVIFLKEELHSRRIIALIFGFIGMLIIIRPGFEVFEIEAYLVVFAALLWSSTDIMIKISAQTHHAFVNTFYFAFFGAICTFPVAIIFWHTPDFTEILWLVLLAILFIVNIVSITKSYEHTDLTIVMPFVFSELIFVALLAYLIFGEVINISTAIGSIIIIVSASYIAYRERIERGHVAQEELAEEFAKELGEDVEGGKGKS